MAATYLPLEILLEIAEQSMDCDLPDDAPIEDYSRLIREWKKHRWTICKVNKAFCKVARKNIFQVQSLKASPEALYTAVGILSRPEIAKNIRTLSVSLPWINQPPGLSDSEQDSDEFEEEFELWKEKVTKTTWGIKDENDDLEDSASDTESDDYPPRVDPVLVANWMAGVAVHLTKLLSICAPTIEKIKIESATDFGGVYGYSLHRIVVEILSGIRFPRLRGLSFDTDEIGKARTFWGDGLGYTADCFNDNMRDLEDFALESPPEGMGTFHDPQELRQFNRTFLPSLKSLLTLEICGIRDYFGEDLAFEVKPLCVLTNLTNLTIAGTTIDGMLSELLLDLKALKKLSLQFVSLDDSVDRWYDVMDALFKLPSCVISLRGLCYTEGDGAHCWRDTFCSPHVEDHQAFMAAEHMDMPREWNADIFWVACHEHEIGPDDWD